VVYLLRLETYQPTIEVFPGNKEQINNQIGKGEVKLLRSIVSLAFDEKNEATFLNFSAVIALSPPTVPKLENDPKY